MSEADEEVLRLRDEIRRWKLYTGSETPERALRMTDPYNAFGAEQYDNIRALFSRHVDAQGARLGWGDFGAWEPTLRRVLEAAGCTPWTDYNSVEPAARDEVLAAMQATMDLLRQQIDDLVENKDT